MNSVQILGNLGRDPIIRATKTGRSVASFSLAVSRNYTTPQGEQRELTDWINVVAWGPLAEAVGNQLKIPLQFPLVLRAALPMVRSREVPLAAALEEITADSVETTAVSAETVITAETADITMLQPDRAASREETLDSLVQRPRMKIFRSDMH